MSRDLVRRIRALETQQKPPEWDGPDVVMWADAAIVAERYGLIPPPVPPGAWKWPASGLTAEQEQRILDEAVGDPQEGGPTHEELEDYRRGFPPGDVPPLPPAA